MGFVFYDCETTGLNTRHDQILHFAAARTNDDLEVIERFEISCRLDQHIIPHPQALLITRRTLASVRDASLPSHYEMMHEIAALLERWGPCVFMGFNSISFDEVMLHHSLYRTLHEPYLTSRPGNARSDVLTLARAAYFFGGGVIDAPLDKYGKRRFTLQALNEANGGPEFVAHTPGGDVDATIALCKLIRSRDEGLWSRFMRFSAKNAVQQLLDDGQPFGVVTFRGNEPQPVVAMSIGVGSHGNARTCLSLSADFDELGAMDDTAIVNLLASADSPLFQIKINGCPCVCDLWDLPETAKGGIDDNDFEARSERVTSDPRLGERLLRLSKDIDRSWGESQYVEERLYESFLPRGDDGTRARFHAASWPERYRVADDLVDERLRQLARRLVFLEAPEHIPKEHAAAMSRKLVDRCHGSQDEKPWLTLQAALDWFKANLDDPAATSLHSEYLAWSDPHSLGVS